MGAAAGFTLDDAGGVTAADGEGAGAGATVAVAGAAGAGVIALTAVLHDPESLARLRLRHSSASLPPGVTPEQFAMKSERQEARIAAIRSCDGCCARAPGPMSSRRTATLAGIALVAVAVKAMVPPVYSHAFARMQ